MWLGGSYFSLLSVGRRSDTLMCPPWPQMVSQDQYDVAQEQWWTPTWACQKLGWLRGSIGVSWGSPLTERLVERLQYCKNLWTSNRNLRSLNFGTHFTLVHGHASGLGFTKHVSECMINMGNVYLNLVLWAFNSGGANLYNGSTQTLINAILWALNDLTCGPGNKRIMLPEPGIPQNHCCLGAGRKCLPGVEHWYTSLGERCDG